MNKLVSVFCIATALLLLPSIASSGRGRAGVGARSVGGGGAVQSYGAGIGTRSTTSILGAGGGSGQAVKASGGYTTKGGSTINYKGSAIGGTTGGGTTAGRYVGGVQVTTPGGKQATKVGTGAGAIGPAGNAIGGKSSITAGSGPNGSFATKSQSGGAIGPNGAVGGSKKIGAVSGQTGTYVGASRGGAAIGSYGAVAGRTTVAAGVNGTYYRSTAAIRGQGAYVRRSVANYPIFRPGWYAQYPGAWFAAGWTARTVWQYPTWSAFSFYTGYPSQPIYYDYGTNVVYVNDSVTVNGQPVATAQEYATQATALANTGRAAAVAKDEQWFPLGVFAMVQGEEKTSNNIFQLATNKQGMIRGNYYDAVTDSSSPVFGSVDKKTQRAAWTVGDRKSPVYEVGIANLTNDETTILVHYSPDRTVQFALIRVEEPQDQDN